MPVGIKHKNSQWLSLDHTGTHTTYNTYGDKIHHNIFRGSNTSAAVRARQDFVQIYNNIANSNKDIGPKDFFEMACSVVYNNLVLGGDTIGVYRSPDNGDGSSYDVPNDQADYHPYCYLYNNIIEDASATINVLWIDSSMHDFYDDLNLNTVFGAVNLFVDRGVTDAVYRSGSQSEHLFNASETVANGLAASVYIQPSTFGLHPGGGGAGNYKCNGTYVADSPKTIANGGVNTSHPYLSGITM